MPGVWDDPSHVRPTTRGDVASAVTAAVDTTGEKIVGLENCGDYLLVTMADGSRWTLSVMRHSPLGRQTP